MKELDTMLESIAQRTAEIILERIEPYLQRESRLVSRQEVMEMLGISETTLWNWEKEGRLKRTGTCGRRVYYDLDDVRQQIQNS